MMLKPRKDSNENDLNQFIESEESENEEKEKES